MPERYRYLMALPRGNNQVLLAWRLLAEDKPTTPFSIERRAKAAADWECVTPTPVIDSTNFLDQTPHGGEYVYRVLDSAGVPSETVEIDSRRDASLLALDVPLNPDDQIHGTVLGDLMNNGRMGYVLRAVRADKIWMLAYSHEGRLLWEQETGLPARGGWDGSTLHVPFLCWDVNADGRTEVAFHSFTGTYPTERYDTGISGEKLTVLDGETGELVWEAPWPAVKSRVMMTVGRLRGMDQPASLVVLDETYGPVVLTGVDGQTGETTWQVRQERPGGHNLDIGDIDRDGVQEVICGGVCYNGDGSVRWEAEPFGHTDISKPCQIGPEREGWQIWYAVESGNPGVYLVDKDGQTLFKEPFRHAHYGWVTRQAPGVPGLHPHTAEDGRRDQRDHFPIYLPDGTHWLNLTDWQRKNFVPVHWDEGPEAVFLIRKENKRLVRLHADGTIADLPDGKLPEGGEYGRNLACADILGDYRENIVAIDAERHRLMVLANPTVAHQRGYSPYQDFDYRHDRSQHGSGYYIYLSPPETVVETRTTGA